MRALIFMVFLMLVFSDGIRSAQLDEEDQYVTGWLILIDTLFSQYVTSDWTTEDPDFTSPEGPSEGPFTEETESTPAPAPAGKTTVAPAAASSTPSGGGSPSSAPPAGASTQPSTAAPATTTTTQATMEPQTRGTAGINDTCEQQMDTLSCRQLKEYGLCETDRVHMEYLCCATCGYFSGFTEPALPSTAAPTTITTTTSPIPEMCEGIKKDDCDALPGKYNKDTCPTKCQNNCYDKSSRFSGDICEQIAADPSLGLCDSMQYYCPKDCKLASCTIPTIVAPK